MTWKTLLTISSLILLLCGTRANAAPPNIVILYADDMGYGDLNIQNPQSKIPTPNLERTVITAVDLLPTLCAAAGVTLPADYHSDGENLLAAFQGKGVTRTRPVFWEWRGNRTEPDWPSGTCSLSFLAR